MIKVNLEAIATRAGYRTISHLSRTTNRHLNTIRLLWYGDPSSINTDVLNQLCAILKTTPGELIEYTPDPPVKLQIHSVTQGQKAESVAITATEPKG